MWKSNLYDAKVVQIRYTDLPGRFLAKYFLANNEDPYDLFRCDTRVDGSSVKGFATIDESDILLIQIDRL